MPALTTQMDVPPYRLSGQVVSTLLNHRPLLEALGDAVKAKPYNAPPQAPVLAVRPRHMHAADGSVVGVPADAAGVEAGVALGIVVGRTACRVPVAQAMAFVAGYVVVGELGLPIDSHYRPAVRMRSRDGFCPLGAQVVAADAVARPDALVTRTFVDGVLVAEGTTGDRLRGVAQLLSDVSAFMTLPPGDVLTLGLSAGAPLARAGQAVRLEIEGVGTLGFTLAALAEAA